MVTCRGCFKYGNLFIVTKPECLSYSWQVYSIPYRLERKYWGSEIMGNLPEASFQEVMEDDAALLGWLRRLEVFGFVVVNGAPAEEGQVRRLAERIAFIRKTHYGYV